MPPRKSGAAIAAIDQVHCDGVHDCKGNSDCKTTENSCTGTNACKGHGFKGMSAKDRLAKDGVIGDIVAKK